VSFAREGLAGIYFLQPYAADRKPVLLVHGMGGTPRDFDALVRGLDRSRFQPWVFYYPTGLDIDVVGTGLLGILNQLWLQHRFSELHVVAHSMGGLVTRSFLKDCREAGECRYMRTFISITSPFGGAPAAQKGVDHSPVVMPAWRDMSPKSTFVADLFAQPLPAGVQHHMVLSYRDATVPLARQLPAMAQRQAASTRGFDDDHMGILEDPLVLQHIDAVLRGSCCL
jgi:triacylglycerol esterase/lipase EstA (alpha/beta hydrolase family)